MSNDVDGPKPTKIVESQADPNFALEWSFPDASAIFTASYKSLDAIKETCVVGIDTGVLLAPYGLGATPLKDIGAVYKKLAKAKRLMVPGRVAREFMRHRSSKLAELVKTLGNQCSQARAPIDKSVKFLEGDSDYEEALKLSKEMDSQGEKLRAAVGKVLDRLGDSTHTDPVLSVYKTIMPDVIFDPHFSDNDRVKFAEELKFRYANNIPPGYKDAKKGNNASGDLVIWKTILEFVKGKNLDFIFVTTDEKNDWYVRVDKGPFQPRYELIDEYRRASGGGSLHILSFPELLRLFKAEEQTVRAIEKAERQSQLATELEERADIEQRLAELESKRQSLKDALAPLGFDPNEYNFSLPWNRAAFPIREQIRAIERQIELLKGRLDSSSAE